MPDLLYIFQMVLCKTNFSDAFSEKSVLNKAFRPELILLL